MKNLSLIDEINRLKVEKDACILAHNYQLPEVQDIADIVGDSFALSRAAANIDKKVIVFCGVKFMAESAKILSPDKIVLLPAKYAGCPLADSINRKQLEREKRKYPDAKVVCYVNSSTEVKAISDICCTSSNAVKVVESIDADQVIFVPDQNLASYVEEKVDNKEIIPWAGHCITHARITMDDVFKAKEEHPYAEILVHPEVSEEIRESADFVGSTSQIIDYAKNSTSKEFIIGTEIGVLHKMKNDNPEKEFYLLSKRLVCENMKMTTLEDVYNALTNMENEIFIPEDTRVQALGSLEKMLCVQ
ncbi:quinolinate synthase NadA [Clostridium tyrobutyricum]|jgi:quinolinate synthase|uniref:Quinolinate synthase n=1 Tax=Clostridium tyrobutyricum DIVETGP TaxID=1408889 RepID=W6NF99_CLOTY|nr:quinolinate synthase NadA [Clostridium tyrobutyricum]AND84176.1 quinolinate synthase [Clostridium tyrobutyricum]ANP68902.1 quinolinate synthase [Clostridium tyrobutyricum]MBV4434504.1 quinolinate synthase NadA [Clostridium tyrobutyricum]MBV4439212.1 quinolinate synthase NadA [Clostridium tyrobutyricum]QCH29238.1 Quinolinate synthase A [Clostridium tyrobutyricum]